eukprot:863892-Amphidinium_carterae.1
MSADHLMFWMMRMPEQQHQVMIQSQHMKRFKPHKSHNQKTIHAPQDSSQTNMELHNIIPIIQELNPNVSNQNRMGQNLSLIFQNRRRWNVIGGIWNGKACGGNPVASVAALVGGVGPRHKERSSSYTPVT